jgi:DNA-binding SARP family transcriptional activator
MLGRHHELIGRLYALTTDFPHSETFCRLLMLALFRSDCRADALKVYESARRKLHEELGLEPGRALRDTQQAILLDVDNRYEASSAC